MNPFSLFSLLFNQISSQSITNTTINTPSSNTWEVIGQSGVTCIHTALLPNSRLLCFERPHEGIYPENPNTAGLLSTEIDLSQKITSFRSIPILNNPFCAGHAQMANGSILVAGGDNKSIPLNGQFKVVNGRKGMRIFNPCALNAPASCIGSWTILPDMTTERWYPTVLTLADASQIILGGSTKNLDFENLQPTDNNPTYEYYPKKTTGTWPRVLDILTWAFPHNLYPPAAVLPSGNIFMLVSNKSIIINPQTDVITNLDDMPSMDHSPWIYPHSATMVVLPMTIKNNFKFELMICGGSKVTSEDASNMCLTIAPDEKSPQWKVVDSMPNARVMPDSVIMPDGKILFANGAGFGRAGGNQGQVQYARDPVYAVDIFDPAAPSGSRWTSVAPASQIRLYHSGALLLETGHVITTGSEMNNYKDLYPTPKDCYPTVDKICTDPFNYNIERYTPAYLSSPRLEIISAPLMTTHDSLIEVNVSSPKDVSKVTFVRTGTSTHQINTDQRSIELIVLARTDKSIYIRVPRAPGMAVPGNWFLFILDSKGVPSIAKTVMLSLGVKTEVGIPANATSVNGPKNTGTTASVCIFACFLITLSAVLF